MKSIWKFKLEMKDEQRILMPQNAAVLSVQVQHGFPCLWALVDTEETLSERTFIINGTGHQCVCGAVDFIGTFMMNSGFFVGHLFEKRSA